jgi:ATP-dependent DNA helicase RecQ
VDEAELEQVAEVIAEADAPLEPSVMADALDLSATKLATSLRHFERAGFATLTHDGRIRQADDGPAVGDAVATGRNGELRRLAFDRSRVELMRAYADSGSCRRAFLLEYLGEPFDPPCRNCDVCDLQDTPAPGVAAAEREEERKLTPGVRVRHSAWGDGTVGQTDAEKLTVAFDTVGYRTLARAVIDADPDLLQQLPGPGGAAL